MADLTGEELQEDGPDNPLDFEANEAANAMDDLRLENIAANSDADVEEMVKQLNTDQIRVFQYVTDTLSGKNCNTPILRHYISGTGGTGKSFLIACIRLWVKQKLGKDVAVSAPTCVAAFNINGLTIYRLLQLPVEHRYNPKFTFLSDQVLQTLRSEMENIVLFVIDEISTISNITFLYIHLRLTEIYGTADETDGWFGKKHNLLFGDLLL
jgi:hypothetical protein